MYNDLTKLYIVLSNYPQRFYKSKYKNEDFICTCAPGQRPHIYD